MSRIESPDATPAPERRLVPARHPLYTGEPAAAPDRQLSPISDLSFRAEAPENGRGLRRGLPFRRATDGVSPEPVQDRRIFRGIHRRSRSARPAGGRRRHRIRHSRAGGGPRRRQPSASPSTSIRMPHAPPPTTPASTASATASPASVPISCRASPRGHCSTSSCPIRRTLPASRAISPTAPGTAARRTATLWRCSSRPASGSPRTAVCTCCSRSRRPRLPAVADRAGRTSAPGWWASARS